MALNDPGPSLYLTLASPSPDCGDLPEPSPATNQVTCCPGTGAARPRHPGDGPRTASTLAGVCCRHGDADACRLGGCMSPGQGERRFGDVLITHTQTRAGDWRSPILYHRRLSKEQRKLVDFTVIQVLCQDLKHHTEWIQNFQMVP